MIQLWQSLLLGIVARLKMWLRGQLLAQSVSFIHLANPTVAMGFHACCGGEGGSAKEELLRRPLGRSNGGDDKNSSNVPIRSLQRDSDNGGPPSPLRSSNNTPALTDSY